MLKCKPGRQWLVHGTVLTDLGCMGDANLCLRCGAESYHRLMFAEERRKTVVPHDWPAIEEARNLLGGINTIISEIPEDL